MKTSIARDIAATGIDAKYDTQCKVILGNKIILAHILKNIIGELKELSIEEIENCIENDIAIGDTPVYPGETNNPKIVGENTENTVLYEGTVYFDVRFSVRIPNARKNGDSIKIITNVEAQQKYNTGYKLETRGIFYGSRLISSQLNTEFTASSYDDMKKVYSIWLCLDAPAGIGNAISEYSMGKRDIIAGIPDRRDAYDKLSVLLIALNEDMLTETTDDNELEKFLRMLNTLFSSKLEATEKIGILKEEYGIAIDQVLGKELDEMCNLSRKVREEGRQEGHQEGVEIGREEGMQIGREQGMQVGRQAGRREEQYKIVKRLIEIGMPDGNIAAVSQLDIGEIEKMKIEMSHGQCEPVGDRL